MFLFTKLSKLWKMFFPDIQAKRVKPWFLADGDYTFRLNYDGLNEKSVVVDLGGYKGQWASDIYGKYKCRIFVFEPAKKFYEFILNRFARNESISAFCYALGGKNKTEFIYINADESSTIRKEGLPEKMEFRKFDIMMKELDVDKIDLLKINIEGGEYDLLEYIIATGWAPKIVNIQVQFHDFFPDAKMRMEKIQAALSVTHRITYQFEFVWENWELK